ncbi:MAG: Gfo/Idh/MocA family oxidoreductase [Clostridiales bacterium]|nr:Gfo/Idh/MocA family oxidoreductase [Clostridiales bacterium]
MKKDTCKIGFIGLGGRGRSMLDLLLDVPGVTVPAVCDKVEDRMNEGVTIVTSHDNCNYTVNGYLDYRELIEKEKLDALFIATTWITHIPIAIDAMNAGLHVCMEVGGAGSVEECWQLIRTSEKTGKFCMLAENCCYDRKEMAVFNMVKQGLFGEIVHLEGGYRHDLRDEIVLGKENIHGRLKNFMHRNGELYPTHEIGPIAKLIGINRGNRFTSLVSVSSKSRGLNQWIKNEKGEDYYLNDYPWSCGDVTSTIITCANGETISIHHDCCLPRPYSREYTVQGTKAIFKEAPDDTNGVIYIDGVSPEQHKWEDFNEKYRDKYDHPLWASYQVQGIQKGHGGMDFLILAAFAESVLLDEQPPIDVYDTAAWMAITTLSEQSVALGGTAVPFPDFTNGRWIEREPFRRGPFCLDEICSEYFK